MESNNDNIDRLFNKTTGIILKQHREEANLSLGEVARKMKTPITRQSLFKYENNLARVKNNIFIEICNVLNIDPDETFSEISQATNRYKYYMDNNYEVSYTDKNGNLKYIDLYNSVSNQEISDEADTSDSSKEDTEQLKQFRLLYDRMKNYSEESQKMVYNVTKSVMDEIDNQLDNKE